MEVRMNISKAANAAGISAKMIRYYEQIGLLPAAARKESGYRQYSSRDVSMLRFIRQARQLGFSMENIANLMGLWSNNRRASKVVKSLAERHVADLAERIRRMSEIKEALESLIKNCSGDENPHCAILDGIAGASACSQNPGSVETKSLRKSPAKGRESKHSGKMGSGQRSTDYGLMAWTQHPLSQRW